MLKKEKRLFGLLALLLGLSFLLAGTGSPVATNQKRYEAQFLTLFDTVTTIVTYTEDKEAFTKNVQFLHDRLEEYHQLFNIYQTYEGINNLKTVNDMAGIAPVPVDERILEMLEFAKEMHRLTGGKVNVAMGSVLSLWHTYREAGINHPAEAALPTPQALLEAAAHTDIHKMILDKKASTVYLEDPKMRLDVGALAKGYAVERVCRQAEAKGFSSGLVSVGGNVRAIGGKDQGKTPWEVGIQNPWQGEEGERLLGTVDLRNKSLVTSGAYQRYYTVDGKRYHHIIHPDTLMPWGRYEAVTILCSDSGKADALSTALFNMEYGEGAALIAALGDTEALWIFPDGTQAQSAGFLMRKQGKNRENIK